MDLTRSIYFILVLFVISGRPSFCQDAEERTPEDPPPYALFLSRYIQIPSVSGTEKAAGEFFAEACQKMGLNIRIFTDHADNYNFSASLFPLELGKPNIIFLTHLDVVPEGDHQLWNYPPYSGAIAEGHLWGRGAFDNKGHGVMMLYALANFVDTATMDESPYNFTLLAVSNEELDGPRGSSMVTEQFLHELKPVAVYGEGGIGCTGILKANPEKAMFGIEIAQKRVLWLKLQSKGAVFGHSSVPSAVYPARELTLATSAILQAEYTVVLTPVVLKMLRMIGCYEKGMRKLALKNYRTFSPFFSKTVCREELMNALLHNTITLTGMGASEGAYNQMAQGVWATFDARLLPGTATEKFLNQLNNQVRNFEVEFTIIKESPAAPPSDTGFYYRALEKAIKETFGDVPVVPMLLPASNDNIYFRANGIPSYGLVPAVFSPEHVQSIHNINECIPLTALEEGIAVYTNLIKILMGKMLITER